MINDIFEELYRLNSINKISLGLHTTSKKNAISILRTGLKETKCRAIEGTVSFKGDVSQVTSSDLDFFFPYTDATVIVAIPSVFDAPRIEDNLGGDTPLCEFSKFMKCATIFDSKFPWFSYTESGITRALIPPELIVGYYDKDYNLTLNEKCILNDERCTEKFQEIKSEYEDIAKVFSGFGGM